MAEAAPLQRKHGKGATLAMKTLQSNCGQTSDTCHDLSAHREKEMAEFAEKTIEAAKVSRGETTDFSERVYSLPERNRKGGTEPGTALTEAFLPAGSGV